MSDIGTKFTIDARPIYKKYLYGEEYKKFLLDLLSISIDDEEYKDACVNYDNMVATMQLYCFYDIMNMHLCNSDEYMNEDNKEFIVEKMIGSALQFDYYRLAFSWSVIMNELNVNQKVFLNNFIKNCNVNKTSYTFSEIIDKSKDIISCKDISSMKVATFYIMNNIAQKYF